MIPTKSSYTTVHEFWRCGVEAHKHNLYHCAVRCIEKQIKKARQKPRRPKDWFANNWRNIIALRESGATYRQMGDEYGVSANRAMQLFQKATRNKAKYEAAIL